VVRHTGSGGAPIRPRSAPSSGSTGTSLSGPCAPKSAPAAGDAADDGRIPEWPGERVFDYDVATMSDSPGFAFFAYGIFRSDEIAFPAIASFVESVTEATVCGRLLERDGLHLLDLNGDEEVEGQLIHFHASVADAARTAIDELGGFGEIRKL
jgi:hypothetical protein